MLRSEVILSYLTLLGKSPSEDIINVCINKYSECWELISDLAKSPEAYFRHPFVQSRESIVTHEQVIGAYRAILGRPPENEDVIEASRVAFSDIWAFVEILLQTPEARVRHTGMLPTICFVHIPKTVGTSMRVAFKTMLGDRACWIHDPEDSNDVQLLRAQCEAGRVNVIGGHVPAPWLRNITSEPRIFAALIRDPVERGVSLFNFIQDERRFHPLQPEMRRLGLAGALRESPEFISLVSNFQCNMIAGQPEFAAAMQTICRDRWLLEPVENAPRLLEATADIFNVPAAALIRENVGTPGYMQRFLTPEARDILVHLNRDDFKLYDFVREKSAA